MNERAQQNQVRQVLMNELGLTRESIRQEVERIVIDTVERSLAGDRLQSLVERIISLRVREYWNQRDRIADTIDKVTRQYVAEEAAKVIAGRLHVSLDEEP